MANSESGGTYPSSANTGMFGRMTMWDTGAETAEQHKKARRLLAEAIDDRDHAAAYNLSFAVQSTRRLHPIRGINGVLGMRNVEVMDLPKATQMSSPLHPEFPEYVGRKVADRIALHERRFAAMYPESPMSTLVREFDEFTRTTYLQPAEDGKKLPQGSEAAEIAAGLAGTYIREPALNETGQRGFVAYVPGGVTFGWVDKSLEDNLLEAGYAMTPPAVSPFVPERELNIYGGQPDFLAKQLRTAHQETVATWIGSAIMQHPQE